MFVAQLGIASHRNQLAMTKGVRLVQLSTLNFFLTLHPALCTPKNKSRDNRHGLLFLVAGAGFEPATFGL